MTNTKVKIVGLSLLLGILLYVVAKFFVSISSIDHESNYVLLTIVWYFLLCLPLSTLLFSSDPRWRKGMYVPLILSVLVVILGTIWFFAEPEFSDDGLFPLVFSLPL